MTFSRKSFLKHTAAASIAYAAPLTLFPFALDKSNKSRIPKTRRFSMSLNPYMIGVQPGITQQALNTIAVKYEFESVAVMAQDLARYSDEELIRLTEDMKEKNIVWGMCSLPVEYRKDDATYKKGLSQLPALAKMLQKIGAIRMMTWIMSNHEELNYLQNFRQTAIRLREVAGILNQYSIRLGLEYVGPKSIWGANKFPFIHTMAETKEMIAAIGQPNTGIHLDTAHWFTAGETISDLLTLTNKEVVGCHLDDAVKGIAWQDQPGYQRELPAATGVIDTKGFLNALVAIGYDGPVEAEPFNEVLNDMDDELAIKTTADSMKKAFALIDL